MPISERNASALLIVLPVVMTACSSSPGPVGHGATVPCGRGAGALAQRCSVERSVTARGTILTLRATDGGFRRLQVLGAGGGLAAADGAQPAVLRTRADGSIDVQVGDDRYRLPAMVAR
jgi:hypothetical protein